MRELLALVLAALLAGCGDLADDAGASALSSGSISGFGSVFVSGTEYQTTGASIQLERVTSTARALRVGMVVVVEGDRAASGLTGSASTIRYDDEIEGPITAISAASGDTKQLSILGQTVTIERNLTRFDASGTSVPTFDTLAVNDLVEVSGFRRAADIQATYVSKKGTAGATPSVELEGSVTGVAGQSFMLGPISVSWSSTTALVNLPSGGPTNGDFVAVEGTLSAATSVQASRIEREAARSGDLADFEIEGAITQFTSLASFRVDGQLADASDASVVFEPNSPLIVKDGARLEVEGELRSGTLFAERVKLRDGEARIYAQIARTSDISVATGSVQLLGIEIRSDAATQFEDRRLADPTFGIGDLFAGDFLEVRGVEDGTGRVLATEIERAENVGDVRLRGRVDAIDAALPDRSVSILGVSIPTHAATRFTNSPLR